MRDLKTKMKELKKEIWSLRLEMLKDTGAVVGLSIVAVLGTLLEAMVVFSKYAILMRAFSGEDPFDEDLNAPELFYDVGDHASDLRDSFYAIRDNKKELKELKQEYKQEQIAIAKEAQKPTFSNEVLERVRTLLIKCEELDSRAQKEFTVRLKETLKNYTDTFVAILEQEENTNEQLTIEELNKRTLGKLSIIETGIKKRIEIEKQVSSIRSEEQELLSMIPSTEETPTEVQTLKLTK